MVEKMKFFVWFVADVTRDRFPQFRCTLRCCSSSSRICDVDAKIMQIPKINYDVNIKKRSVVSKRTREMKFDKNEPNSNILRNAKRH